MFPDIHSEFHQNSSHSRPTRAPWIVVGVLAGLLVAFLHFESMIKLAEYGLLPGVANFGLVIVHPQPLIYTTPTPLIPITGINLPQTGQRLFMDRFGNDLQDWRLINGSMHQEDGSLLLSPELFDHGGMAAWQLPGELLPSSFVYTARIGNQARYDQVFGLMLNYKSDGSAILFLIDPARQTATIARLGKEGLIPLTGWQMAATVYAAPNTNELSVQCSPDALTFIVNGAVASTLNNPPPCQEGMVGVFVRSPGWVIRVEETALYAAP